MFKLKFHVLQEYDENYEKEGEEEITYDYLVFSSKKKMFLYDFRKKDEFLCASLTKEDKHYIYFSYSTLIYKKMTTLSNSFEKDEMVII